MRRVINCYGMCPARARRQRQAGADTGDRDVSLSRRARLAQATPAVTPDWDFPAKAHHSNAATPSATATCGEDPTPRIGRPRTLAGLTEAGMDGNWRGRPRRPCTRAVEPDPSNPLLSERRTGGDVRVPPGGWPGGNRTCGQGITRPRNHPSGVVIAGRSGVPWLPGGSGGSKRHGFMDKTMDNSAGFLFRREATSRAHAPTLSPTRPNFPRNAHAGRGRVFFSGS